MKLKTFSELQQERAGTLNRNKFIQYLYFQRGWRQVDIAKRFGVSRQCIHHIIHRTCGEKYGFWTRLIDRILWLFGEDY